MREEGSLIRVRVTGLVSFRRVGNKEGVLHVPGGMLLGDEEGVEVPEACLDEIIRGHFREAHFEEYLAELVAYFHYWATLSMTNVDGRLDVRGCSAPLCVGAPFALKLYGFNFTVFQAPLSELAKTVHRNRGALPRQHVGRKIGLFLHELHGVLWSLIDFKYDNLLWRNKLSLFEVGQDFGFWMRAGLLNRL